MAYIFDPIRNTFVDDEDTSLGNKLALNDTSEEIIKQIDDKFGPGTVFPASELPEPENPYKDFEDRNPAADGGMIGGGIIDGEDYGTREGFNRPKLKIPGLEKKIAELFGQGLSNNQVLKELKKIAKFEDVTLGVIKRIKKESGLGGQKEALTLSQEEKYNKLKQLVENSNNKLKFVDMKTLRGEAGLPRKEAPTDKLNLERFNVPKLETATDKVTKAFNSIIDNPDISVEKVFDISSKISSDTGLSQSSTSEVLNKLPEYQEFIPVRDILAKPASKANLIKKIKSGDRVTLGDVMDMANQKPISGTSLSGTNTPERFIINSVKRHIAQGGDKIQWVKAPGTFDKSGMVTDATSVFKYKGNNYNYYDLLQNGRKIKDFKEVYKTFDDMNNLLSRETTDPVTKQKISFKELMQKAYSKGANFKSTSNPYEVDHFGSVKSDPFSNLRILPYRINRVQGALFNKATQVEAGVLKPETAEMYTPEKIKNTLKKSGYDFTKDIDQLFNDEIKLADDILIKNRKLKTPIQISKDLEKNIETPTFRDKIKSGASAIKSKMDASKMITSKIPGGAVALTPLDFMMSMAAGAPLVDAAASAGSYLIKDPYLGRAINIPLALREATNYGDENEMLQKATDRREKGEAFLQGLLDKVKGAEEQPDIDPFQAAEGGRVGFNGGGAVGADDNFAKELEYYFLNDDVELPKAESYRETTNPVSVLKDIVDPRNYPYYADRLVESGIRVGEFGARALPATGKLISDLIQKPAFKVKGGTGQGYVQDYTDIPPSNIKGTGIFSEFLDNLVGTEGTEVITEKTGLKELIKSEEQKQKDRRSTVGPKVFADQASLGLELTAPIFPGAKLLKAYAKNRKLPVDQTTKEVMEKEIDEVLSKQNISRRDFLKATGAGSAVVIAKMLGFGDELATTTKVVEKATKEAATTSGVPPYFLNLVKKIKTKGDETLATKDKATAYKYDDYYMEEDFAGNIEITRKGDMDVPGYEEVYMSYRVDEVPTKGKVVEYEEYTARPDGDGKMKDVEDGVPDDVIEEGTIFEDNITDFDK